MRPLSILLSILLAFSFVAIGCEKKTEEAPAAEPMTPPDKAEAPAEGEAKAEAPAEPAAPAVKLDPEVQKILDAAMAAHGGAEKLKAAMPMTIKTKGKTNQEDSTATWILADDRHAGQINFASGKVWSMARGSEDCWFKGGPVVHSVCEGKWKNGHLSMARWITAWYMQPLTEKEMEIEAGKTKVGKKECDSLTIDWPDLNSTAALMFDPESHLLIQSDLTVKYPESSEKHVMKMSDHKEFCGTKMASKFMHMHNGKLIESFEVTEATCGQVDESMFQQPEQVADGTIEEKESSARTVACTTMKGPYDKTAENIEKLTGFMKKQKLAPAGAPMMIYLKGPPKVKKAKKYLTEICIPVATKAPKKPKKKGKFVIKAMKPQKVLAAYGVGPYETKSPELMKLLIDEAKKRKLKTAGPMCQISFMDPKETAAEELVSEMQIPIKGGKKKKK